MLPEATSNLFYLKSVKYTLENTEFKPKCPNHSYFIQDATRKGTESLCFTRDVEVNNEY